ncbi:TolB family protein [Candidatus Eisenbacteria bacterium]|uniref:TolB family protein n=1 Tax=Eiseniibacteriota bacterium TaxID=2212470 RepID=A0ABV6YKL4_UNCEI
MAGLIGGLVGDRTCHAAGRIAFSRETRGTWQIWTMSEDGTNLRQLTHSQQDKRDPTCASDGERLAFRTNNGQLYVLTLATREERTVLRRLRNISSPNWSSVRDEIVFVRLDPLTLDIGDIWKSDIDGRNAVMLTQGGGRLSYHPVFSPLGERIAYVYSAEPDHHEIWTMDADGGNAHVAVSGGRLNSSPSFSPDGQTLAFVSDRTGDFEIYSTALAAQDPVRLTHNPGLDTSPCFIGGGGGVSPSCRIERARSRSGP